MRRLFFHVFIDMRTIPESHERTIKPSAKLEAGDERPRFRVRREMRMRIGMRARLINDQSRAMKLAFGIC